ncbi:hypothetical protein ACGFYP_26745 [Streptomyces sp. NPDC048370]|uniref:hypothetical protein n=1 Tax=Streptomyces sp. NPDC048370 TaxID=3365540 RepID=UPI00371EFE71
MSQSKHRALGLTCAVLLATLVGCGGGGGADAGGSLGVDRVVELAEGVGKDGADACPIPYDAGKAAEAAKVGEGIEAGAAGAEAGKPMATGEGGKTSDPQSAFAGKPGGLISCSYHVGGEDLTIHTVGTEAGSAINILLPTAQNAGSMSVEDVKAFHAKAADAKFGEPAASRGGNVVTVRLDSGGKGDVALLLTVGEEDKSALKPEQVQELARTFAAQAK